MTRKNNGKLFIMNTSEDMTEFDKILREMKVYKANMVSKLKDDILNGKYLIHSEEIARKILCNGMYIIKFSKICNNN